MIDYILINSINLFDLNVSRQTEQSRDNDIVVFPVAHCTSGNIQLTEWWQIWDSIDLFYVDYRFQKDFYFKIVNNLLLVYTNANFYDVKLFVNKSISYNSTRFWQIIFESHRFGKLGTETTNKKFGNLTVSFKSFCKWILLCVKKTTCIFESSKFAI